MAKSKNKEIQVKPNMPIDAKMVTIVGTIKSTLRTGRKYTLPLKLAMIFIKKGFATLLEEETFKNTKK